MRHEFLFSGRPTAIGLERHGDEATARIGERLLSVSILHEDDGFFVLEIDGHVHTVHALAFDDGIEVFHDGVRARLTHAGTRVVSRRSSAGPAGDGKIRTPMPGKVVAVRVKEGDEVRVGQPLLVLESMKMQNDVVAPIDGRVAAVRCAEGATVAFGDLLVEITPAAPRP
jgi:biotin carboxyl carrier protein